jgi:hypothetical protein
MTYEHIKACACVEFTAFSSRSYGLNEEEILMGLNILFFAFALFF